jgi:hypothetical protein
MSCGKDWSSKIPGGVQGSEAYGISNHEAGGKTKCSAILWAWWNTKNKINAGEVFPKHIVVR